MNVKTLINLLWEYDPNDTVYVHDSGIIIHENDFDIDDKILLDKYNGDIDDERNYY